MSDESSVVDLNQTSKMPKAVKYILGNEAFERFGFYGMRCILIIFMTKYLLGSGGQLDVMSNEQSMVWSHMFVGAVYFATIIGALISDIFLGKYKTILYFSIVYCVGLAVMSVNHTRVGLAAGLIMVVVGSGGHKPCISAFLGDQFGKSNQNLVSRVYSWFYFSVNLGAFISNIICPWLLAIYGPTLGFGVPAVCMSLATVVFWLGNKSFTHTQVKGAAFIKETFSSEGILALSKLCIIFLFIAMFWALFDQTYSAWILQAEQMDHNWLGLKILPAQMAAANPLIVMLLIPVFSYWLYPAIDKIFKLNPLRKISIGFFITAASFAVSAWIEQQISAGNKITIGWQVLAYLILTSAEVMVSITALEFAYTQAPKKMKSFVMAVFLLSVTLGNVFTAVVNQFIQNVDGTSKLEGASYYWFFTFAMLGTAVVFIPVAKLYREKSYIQD